MADSCFYTEIGAIGGAVSRRWVGANRQSRPVLHLNFDGKPLEVPLRFDGDSGDHITVRSTADSQHSFEYRVRHSTFDDNVSDKRMRDLVFSLSRRFVAMKLVELQDSTGHINVVAETKPVPLIDIVMQTQKIHFSLYSRGNTKNDPNAWQEKHKIGSLHVLFSMTGLTAPIRDQRAQLKELEGQTIALEAKLNHLCQRRRDQSKPLHNSCEGAHDEYTTNEDVDDAVVRTRDVLVEREHILESEWLNIRDRCENIADQLPRLNPGSSQQEASDESALLTQEKERMLIGEEKITACIDSMRLHMRSLQESHSRILRHLTDVAAGDKSDACDPTGCHRQATAIGDLGTLAVWAASALDSDALLYREALCHLQQV